MTAISNLPNVLVEEILSRVPITSLRAMKSTCKLWNMLLKDTVIFGKEIMFVFLYDSRACLLNFNKDLEYPFIKQTGKAEQVEISRVFHCNGLLLLCRTLCSSLIVWNPYLGQTRWIDPRSDGYSTGPHYYCMGYDNNNNHKILGYSYRHSHINCEIYDFKSSSWRLLLGIKMDWIINSQGVSLKGDNYFIEKVSRSCIICFDFTRETFLDLSPLPCDSGSVELDSLSVVSEEKLAVLCKRSDRLRLEIWITNKINPNEVSWSYFLKIRIPYERFFVSENFFVDEEKKLAVVFILDAPKKTYKVCVVGEGHYRELDLKEYNRQYCMCSLYVPSLRWIE